MSQNVSECIKMCAEWIVKMFHAQKYHKSAVVTLKWAKIGDLGAKIAHFLLNAQNASICIRMHQNVCRMNYSNVLSMKFQFEKFHFFGWKLPIFSLSAQNASICIGMHQNLCRMNCANVLCTKSSKKWFSLHFNWVKLTNYILHFVFADPVFHNKMSEEFL